MYPSGRLLRFAVPGLRREVIFLCGAVGRRRKTMKWLCRAPEQPWGLADPGWHPPWVHGAEQGLGEQAES